MILCIRVDIGKWILVTKTLFRQKGKLHCGTFRQGYMLSSLGVQCVNKVSWIINYQNGIMYL